MSPPAPLLMTAFGYYHLPNPKVMSSVTNHQRLPFGVYFSIYGVRYIIDLTLVHLFADLFIGRCVLFVISFPAQNTQNEAQEHCRYELRLSTDSCWNSWFDVSRHT